MKDQRPASAAPLWWLALLTLALWLLLVGLGAGICWLTLWGR